MKSNLFNFTKFLAITVFLIVATSCVSNKNTVNLNNKNKKTKDYVAEFKKLKIQIDSTDIITNIENSSYTSNTKKNTGWGENINEIVINFTNQQFKWNNWIDPFWNWGWGSGWNAFNRPWGWNGWYGSNFGWGWYSNSGYFFAAGWTNNTYNPYNPYFGMNTNQNSYVNFNRLNNSIETNNLFVENANTNTENVKDILANEVKEENIIVQNEIKKPKIEDKDKTDDSPWITSSQILPRKNPFIKTQESNYNSVSSRFRNNSNSGSGTNIVNYPVVNYEQTATPTKIKEKNVE